MWTKNRYKYYDNDEYYSITDTKEYNKSFEDFKQQIIDDYGEEEYTSDEIKEIAEEEYYEYLVNNCMWGKEIAQRLNKQEEVIDMLNIDLQNYSDIVYNFFYEHWDELSDEIKDDALLELNIEIDYND